MFDFKRKNDRWKEIMQMVDLLESCRNKGYSFSQILIELNNSLKNSYLYFSESIDETEFINYNRKIVSYLKDLTTDKINTKFQFQVLKMY
jgi:hypothetical protein